MASGVDLLESKPKRVEGTFSDREREKEKKKKWKNKISLGTKKADDIGKGECLQPLSVEKVLLSPPL